MLTPRSSLARVSDIQLVAPTLDDSDRITLLINRSEAFDGVPRILDSDELREELEAPNIDLQRDGRLVVVDGELVAWVLVDHTPSGEVQERAIIGGNVDPAHRGRCIGRTLMSWALEHATNQLARIDNDLPKYIRVYGYEQITDLHHLLTRMGLTQVRWFEELLMPLDLRPGVIHPGLDEAHGVSIIPWPAERCEELRTVKNTAFADHWGSTPNSVGDWDSRVNGFGSLLDLSFAAIDESGALVGLCLNRHFPADEALSGRRDGWIDTLGTLKEWRGRGIASSLVRRSLEAFAGAEFTHAAIGVDSASPTGASRLYRALGFELQHRVIVSEIRVA